MFISPSSKNNNFILSCSDPQTKFLTSLTLLFWNKWNFHTTEITNYGSIVLPSTHCVALMTGFGYTRVYSLFYINFTYDRKCPNQSAIRYNYYSLEQCSRGKSQVILEVKEVKPHTKKNKKLKTNYWHASYIIRIISQMVEVWKQQDVLSLLLGGKDKKLFWGQQVYIYLNCPFDSKLMLTVQESRY